VTWYFINVFSQNGHQWATRARFSSFESLQRIFEHVGIQLSFPGFKMPLRSFFGLTDSAKEDRRVALEQWLLAAVTLSVRECPWMRRHINTFLHAESHYFLRTSAQSAASDTSPDPHLNVTVIEMPAVTTDELLEIEVNGQTFIMYAQAGTLPGQHFEIQLPKDDSVNADEMYETLHVEDPPAITSRQQPQSSPASSSEESNPFGEPKAPGLTS